MDTVDDMSGTKRTYDGREMEKATSTSPVMAMFIAFKEDLDRHHDTRERIVKASRDVTASSKKVIFSLQRVCVLKQAIPTKIAAETLERFATIAQVFASISPDLKGINVWRYQRQISPGIQEFMEAISFEHYLRTQLLIRWEEALYAIPEGIVLTSDDYVLGLFDLVGELMRYAITIIATSGSLPGTKETDSSSKRTILEDLRLLRTHFEALDTNSCAGTGLGKDVEKKVEVMKTCVEKVEAAAYGIVIRGKERPKGWMPDLVDDRPPLESY